MTKCFEHVQEQKKRKHKEEEEHVHKFFPRIASQSVGVKKKGQTFTSALYKKCAQAVHVGNLLESNFFCEPAKL